jgi:hypothetical protein
MQKVRALPDIMTYNFYFNRLSRWFGGSVSDGLFIVNALNLYLSENVCFTYSFKGLYWVHDSKF